MLEIYGSLNIQRKNFFLIFRFNKLKYKIFDFKIYIGIKILMFSIIYFIVELFLNFDNNNVMYFMILIVVYIIVLYL